MLFNDGQIELSPLEFRLFRDLIYDYCGVYFQEDVKYVVERRLSKRIQALSMQSFADYFHHLKYHPERKSEYEELVELLTTHETYFFREEYQLKAFSQEILPQLHQRGQKDKRLRIWSAGCSTGEEPYTVGMLLHESRTFDDWRLEIFANDISRRVLAVARRGIYSQAAFRTMEQKYITKYFTQQENKYLLDDRVRSMVNFGHLNLMDRDMLELVGKVDIIFCRNVLIYFDTDSKKAVIDTFYDHLVKGGYLLLGHSESLINLSTAFELVYLKNDMVYRRPEV